MFRLWTIFPGIYACIQVSNSTLARHPIGPRAIEPSNWATTLRTPMDMGGALAPPTTFAWPSRSAPPARLFSPGGGALPHRMAHLHRFEHLARLALPDGLPRTLAMSSRHATFYHHFTIRYPLQHRPRSRPHRSLPLAAHRTSSKIDAGFAPRALVPGLYGVCVMPCERLWVLGAEIVLVAHAAGAWQQQRRQRQVQKGIRLDRLRNDNLRVLPPSLQIRAIRGGA
ncbi:hypothetical protein C8R45DRAFT_1216451 [Mycena sanguinolenta]|nr:hypothetical protein C8R45DRAFT_1216451 [Mycena sanguinolenta]